MLQGFTREGGKERYVWTTGAWLIDKYLETADEEAVKKLEEAIAQGDICWNAMPFTPESESCNEALFRGIMKLNTFLDNRYGRKTVAAKVTDVPGHTRSIVPILHDSGIRMLHVGVNGPSTVPEVPPFFKWRDEASEKEIIMVYDSQYGGEKLLPDGKTLLVGEAKLALTKREAGHVRAELEGYGTMTKTITLDNGQSVREEFRLSNVMGRLEVRTSPVGAQVFLDGKSYGVTKSKDPEAEFSDILAIENVMEGEHTLVMKMDGYADKTCHPKVKSESTAKFHNQRLRRIFTPDVEIVTARGSYQGVLINRAGDRVEIETKPGITQSFSRDEIRDIKFLKSEK